MPKPAVANRHPAHHQGEHGRAFRGQPRPTRHEGVLRRLETTRRLVIHQPTAVRRSRGHARGDSVERRADAIAARTTVALACCGCATGTATGDRRYGASTREDRAAVGGAEVGGAAPCDSRGRCRRHSRRPAAPGLSRRAAAQAGARPHQGLALGSRGQGRACCGISQTSEDRAPMIRLDTSLLIHALVPASSADKQLRGWLTAERSASL